MCTSMAQFKLIIRLEKWYIVGYIFKYRTSNLIIIYNCIYSGLLNTVENVIWNSMELMRDAGFGPWIDKWLK